MGLMIAGVTVGIILLVFFWLFTSIFENKFACFVHKAIGFLFIAAFVIAGVYVLIINFDDVITSFLIILAVAALCAVYLLISTRSNSSRRKK